MVVKLEGIGFWAIDCVFWNCKLTNGMNVIIYFIFNFVYFYFIVKYFTLGFMKGNHNINLNLFIYLFINNAVQLLSFLKTLF